MDEQVERPELVAESDDNPMACEEITAKRFVFFREHDKINDHGIIADGRKCWVRLEGVSYRVIEASPGREPEDPWFIFVIDPETQKCIRKEGNARTMIRLEE